MSGSARHRDEGEGDGLDVREGFFFFFWLKKQKFPSHLCGRTGND